MNRKKFLKNLALGASAGILIPSAVASNKRSTYDKLMSQVGFNHIPKLNNSSNSMKTILHKANERGRANHGWLDSYHSFSFANYYNPDRMNFGLLRVLNDDIVAPGRGFGAHPHDNMEIVSIPLSGDLEHKDTMGNVAVIKQNDVQLMSAGTGIQHSEYNKNQDKEVRFLQIWVFPKHRNIKPKYEQKLFLPNNRLNQLKTIVSPITTDDALTINQDSWFSLAHFEAGKTSTYNLNMKGNGVYAFLIEGEASIGNNKLSKRDALGIWDVDSFDIQFSKKSELLLIEVPMSM